MTYAMKGECWSVGVPRVVEPYLAEIKCDSNEEAIAEFIKLQKEWEDCLFNCYLTSLFRKETDGTEKLIYEEER